MLTDAHIAEIVKLFADKQDVAHICKMVENSDIEANDYNLAVSSYVEAEDTKEVIDIAVLNDQIRQTVSKISTLRQSIEEIIAQIEVE